MTAPAPAGGFVGVLSRRGRFIVAEPFFGDAHGRYPQRHGRTDAIVVATPSKSGGREAKIGDLVLLGQPSRPGKRSAGRPRIVRIIGSPERPANVIEALLLDRGLRRGFDPAVEHEARTASQRASSENRRDLRSLPTFTVDPASARDFDDAISAETLPDGRIRVWVHIADVSAHVPLGSLVDREARRRSTSVYVPGAVEPMLPPTLSNEACSLVPGRDRLTVTVELDLDGENVVRSAFYRSVIRSDARLDYEEVDLIFTGRRRACEPWAGALRAARQAASALNDSRQRRRGVVLESPEPEFTFDRDGNVTVVNLLEQATESHNLIEQLMIAANEAVAALLERAGTPCLYRVHERPTPERIERLADQLATLEVPTPPLSEHLSSSEAAELVAQMSRMVDAHARRIATRVQEGKITGSPTGGRMALTSLVLRSLQQAYYSPQNLGHSGLGSNCYCHFTSPIRRYPDLVCHRALLHTLGAGEGEIDSRGVLGDLGVFSSEREREAAMIERDADDIASCFALSQQLDRDGWRHTFSGEITGLISAGAFVAFGPVSQSGTQLPPFEGLLPVRELTLTTDGQPSSQHSVSGSRTRRAHRPERRKYEQPREWWELNPQATILHGTRSGSTLRLGDPIEVRVSRVEIARGRVGLTPADS